MKGSNINNEWWNKFHAEIVECQRQLSRLSIDWCSPMPFGGLANKELQAANWQSDHCSSFTRLSLYQFSHLDDNSGFVPQYNGYIKHYRRMSILWFCLVSHAFGKTEENVSPNKVGHLVRLFLSSCKSLHCATHEENHVGFYETKSNYYTLLNMMMQMERFGSLSDDWEGDDEKFIQKVKREISTLRYSTPHLKVLLEKLLQTDFLQSANTSNPMREGIKHYARLQTMRVYSKIQTKVLKTQRMYSLRIMRRFQASLTNMETLVVVLNCLIY